ncbi:MAG: hypothetical protein QOF98_1219 [Streptomyces sp.]|nr:hypothetical protein [Streptomyces sp.]
MRALRGWSAAGAEGGRGWRWKTTYGALALVGGALWWWAVLRLAIRPDAVGPWEGAAAVSGWSLGLIPLHAVPATATRAVSRLRGPGRAGSGDTSTPPGSAPQGRAART